MATRNGTITITIEEPDADNPTIVTETFTYDDEEDMTGTSDIVYLAGSGGSGTMRPSKPRF